MGSNQQQRLDLINEKLRIFYSRHQGLHKLPKITLQSIIGSSGWAELAGPAIKAAGTRASAPFFAELCKEYFNSDSVEDRDVRRVTGNLCEFYNIIGTSSMFMSAAELRGLADACDDMGASLQGLRGLAAARNELVWQVRPKCHKAMHLPYFASVINPHSLNCYVRESQVGTSQRVWRASVQGRWVLHAQRTVLAKRWLGLLLRLEAEL